MKRLSIFLDGTWNTLENNTNVWRLKSLCDPTAVNQLVYYGKGVGTTAGERFRGGAAGYGIDHEILEAYEWLIQVFEPGDQLFVFGFSRGAYAARSLSGLIAKCGVLTPGAPLSTEQLFARYRRYSERTLTALHDSATGSLTLEERWIAKYCVATKIRFVGVWDTVGSVGNPLSPLRRRVMQYRFLDTHLRLQNEFAFHALALDEHRKAFEPTPGRERSTIPPPRRRLVRSLVLNNVGSSVPTPTWVAVTAVTRSRNHRLFGSWRRRVRQGWRSGLVSPANRPTRRRRLRTYTRRSFPQLCVYSCARIIASSAPTRTLARRRRRRASTRRSMLPFSSVGGPTLPIARRASPTGARASGPIRHTSWATC